MARPITYEGEKTDNEAFAYIQHCNNEYKDGRLVVNLPTIEGLAEHLEISRSTLYLWQKQYSSLSDIIEMLQQKQIRMLINSGLSGDYNSTISKVLLGKHGYTDKSEVEQSGGITIKYEKPGDYLYPSQDQSDPGIPESL